MINQPLFDLRDPSSGAPGTRSGQAMQWLLDNGFQPTEVNLFTLTAMIDNPADFPDPFTEFQNQIDPVTGELDQTFVDNVLAAYDIVPDSSDPLFEFAFQTQLNNKTGTIQGLEWAWQHFFGDSGFGIQANYTTVNGDVGIDVGAPPSEDQFALLGLSDTANLTLIYERGGFSARASYNWRDSYLRSVNRGGDRNPVFVDDYRQIDVSLAWQVTDFLALTLEGINVNGENTKHYGRDESNLWLWQEFQPRYLFGARVEF
ncbi:MAG: hypothetical protein KatS3mg121_0957 [Gammaproteobacteria bacterium]|nr:MAG: hypothetical protein KatS3mg121_0957 [Gammaproteobacteria bacterium]